jgi:hypothetical protein
MSRFVNALIKARKEKKLVLIASLPRNDADLARAALDAGADAVKIHINVHHHASNTHFGTLNEERNNLTAILKVWEGRLTGIMPYAAPVNDPDTFNELADMGFDFYSQYLGHAVAGCLPSPDRVARMLALAVDDPIELASGLDLLPVQVCELSIMDGNTYGQPFTYHDILRYSAIRVKTNLPLVVPSQHLVVPESVPDLIQIGIEGLMIGAVVAGSTVESWTKSIKAFRNVIDKN